MYEHLKHFLVKYIYENINYDPIYFSDKNPFTWTKKNKNGIKTKKDIRNETDTKKPAH